MMDITLIHINGLELPGISRTHGCKQGGTVCSENGLNILISMTDAVRVEMRRSGKRARQMSLMSLIFMVETRFSG